SLLLVEVPLDEVGPVALPLSPIGAHHHRHLKRGAGLELREGLGLLGGSQVEVVEGPAELLDLTLGGRALHAAGGRVDGEVGHRVRRSHSLLYTSVCVIPSSTDSRKGMPAPRGGAPTPGTSNAWRRVGQLSLSLQWA